MGKDKRSKKSNEVQVKCVVCERDVIVTLIPYRGGYIAICPECGKIAYSDDEKPPE